MAGQRVRKDEDKIPTLRNRSCDKGYNPQLAFNPELTMSSKSATSSISTSTTSPDKTDFLDTLYVLQKRASTLASEAESRATFLAAEFSRRESLRENQDWKIQRLKLKLLEYHAPEDEGFSEEEFKLAVELYMELCNECNEVEVALMEAEREARQRRGDVKRAEERLVRAVWRRSRLGSTSC
ncbi:Hypothetical predicted protein [Lecanosticta acicola]|uniref:Uncharacterized protein n=1 Tax=Lecanosticta acicola TaxID=111012 RepID=A0AAI8YUA3_9PEZI|nr:Hypothetical predicted protein [Lecanosticta acicola]